MSKERVYLIVKSDRRVRAVKRLPELRLDEVAVAIDLTFPSSWGRIVQTIEVSVPDFTPTAAADPAGGAS